MPFLRKQGPDFPEHLGFHLAQYAKNDSYWSRLLSKAGYVAEEVDDISGNTLMKILFP